MSTKKCRRGLVCLEGSAYCSLWPKSSPPPACGQGREGSTNQGPGKWVAYPRSLSYSGLGTCCKPPHSHQHSPTPHCKQELHAPCTHTHTQQSLLVVLMGIMGQTIHKCLAGDERLVMTDTQCLVLCLQIMTVCIFIALLLHSISCWYC